ncbi:putative beta-flanking protein [Lyophyllum shimeji]|uniref:Beta-flanking protein n=1 Tax=Lyophyllum shimeji TaxID=47721 RepID=A0A9P3PI72_LYOSH|nr:putative beta-flanking protein [Lyophyllum shimeji]
MDTFISLAKQGLNTYSEESRSDVHKTGGHEYNSPDNTVQNSAGGRPPINNEEAIRTAREHGSGESSLFNTALSFMTHHKDEHERPLDEEHVTSAHEKAYGQGNASSLSASSLGSAAALQVLKQFTSGKQAGGDTQTQLISMAMAEASKLFDNAGGASSGNKQDAVNGAAMTVMKLLVQSKFSGTTGGSNSGGLGGLLSLASKFAN